ncbi:MAG: hypothetical protein K5986_11320 [Clostridium sp.]|uniref:hypothetical protein n=1 Tax=Clostridium sp. DSM 8431 TaxID=1761781 RepID=UPI0008F28286|nr:hypothetical protein [Clostridium sp. DSM 8431]MCR4945003.1 hypothetical protein [Clostridium sp.]SFU89487.1 hypothetical protein SAMN04487886_12892 [Clostridium sp. DSM 8431]
MFYNRLEERLVKIFKDNDFIGAMRRNEEKFIPVKNKYDLDLQIKYPGYKAEIRNGKVIYDYRVDYNSIPISHVNVVVDLYNKIVQAPQLRELYREFLVDISRNGWGINLDKYKGLDEVKIKNPSEELLNHITVIHNGLNKSYNRIGNEGKVYSTCELAYFISLIVMQEDINYPMPRYEGRRMSFYRYLEAINGKDLSHVIRRTLSHTRPPLLDGINYKEIIELPSYV